MALSAIARSIGDSATLKLNQIAKTLRAEGEPVIHLGGGEPSGKAPQEAISSAYKVLDTGRARYTAPDGIKELKQAIIGYTEQFYGRHPSLDNVIASSGAKQAIMNVLHALVDPLEEVVFPVPYWVSYPEMVRLAGGVPVAMTTADGSFVPTIEDFERVVTSKTKLIILNSPNNPSGAVYPGELLEEVFSLCERRDIYIMMDDIYHRLVFDGRQPVNVFDYTRRDVDTTRLILVNGVSKQYAMTGFRIGWAVGAREVVRAMAKIQGHESSGPSVILQHAAIGALSGVQDGVEDLRQELEANRNLMVAGLRTIPDLTFEEPGGTFYAFPDFSQYSNDSVALSQYLLDKVSVVTVPGVEFGMEGHLRLSFCGAASDIEEGIARIKWALDPNGPDELALGERTVTRDRVCSIP